MAGGVVSMRAMKLRRALLLLLLLLMPLQFSWAVVSNYCQHESDGSAAHFGHHPHQHQDEDGAPAASKLAGADPDCGSCHSGFCSLPCMAATSPDTLAAATRFRLIRCYPAVAGGSGLNAPIGAISPDLARSSANALT